MFQISNHNPLLKLPLLGYKFNIFYPDLIDKAKAPTYHVEKSDTADTVTRFSSGQWGKDVHSPIGYYLHLFTLLYVFMLCDVTLNGMFYFLYHIYYVILFNVLLYYIVLYCIVLYCIITIVWIPSWWYKTIKSK